MTVFPEVIDGSVITGERVIQDILGRFEPDGSIKRWNISREGKRIPSRKKPQPLRSLQKMAESYPEASEEERERIRTEFVQSISSYVEDAYWHALNGRQDAKRMREIREPALAAELAP